MNHVAIRTTAEGEPDFSLPANHVGEGVMLAIVEGAADVLDVHLRLWFGAEVGSKKGKDGERGKFHPFVIATIRIVNNYRIAEVSSGDGNGNLGK